MTANSIAERLSDIEQRIHTALKTANREGPVMVCAVSKKVDISRMEEAILAGQIVFGESYVQEGRAKIDILRAKFPALKFHYIGRLQRNKARDAVRIFDVLETIDRSELAELVNEEAEKIGRRMLVFAQVNTSGEETKAGVLPEHLAALVERILLQPHLSLQGLMTIGRYYDPTAPDDTRRREFASLAELRSDIEKRCGVELPHLSMGMSHDFELAVEEGATIVRVGTALFGSREKASDSN